MKSSLLALTGLACFATAGHIPGKKWVGPWDPKEASCPLGSLTEPYVSTSAIIPISASHPETAYGAGNKSIVTPNDFCSIFNLFVPASASNSTCNLMFWLPNHWDSSTPYRFHGPGNFQFFGYTGYGGFPNTTYNDQPPPGPPAFNPPPAVFKPGNKYLLHSGSCLVQPNMVGGLEVGGKLCSNDTYFEFEESAAPCPIGFFIEIN